MLKNQDSQDDYTFLSLLNEDPEAEPETQFIKNLRNELIMKANQKVRRIQWFSVTASIFLVTTVAVSLFLIINNSVVNELSTTHELITPNPAKDLSVIKPNEEDHVIEILEKEQINKLFTISYGEEPSDFGQPLIMLGGGDFTPLSFFVKNNLFYIIDNAEKKVVVTTETEHLISIPVHPDAQLKDLFVDEEGNIYVLDIAQRTVSKYNKSGNLMDDFHITDSSFIPTSLTVNQENEPIVFEGESKALNLVDGKEEKRKREFDGTLVNVNVSRNFDEAQINLDDQNGETKISIPFEHSYILLWVHDINPTQILFEKIEKNEKSQENSESHMYVIDRSGSILGAVRIPDDHTEYYTEHRIRFENGQIYFMSAESDGVSIYSLTPGKIFEKKLSTVSNDNEQ